MNILIAWIILITSCLSSQLTFNHDQFHGTQFNDNQQQISSSQSEFNVPSQRNFLLFGPPKPSNQERIFESPSIWIQDHISMTLPDKGNDIEKPSDEEEEDGDDDDDDESYLEQEYDSESNSLDPNIEINHNGDTESKNSNKNGGSKSVNLKKLNKNHHKDGEPYLRVIGKLSNLTRESETKVRLKCSFRGYPLPAIKWFKNEAPIEEIKGKSSIRVIPSGNGKITSRLLMNNLDVHDTGYYKCEAFNKYSTVETLGILVVTSGTGSGTLGSINIPVIPDYSHPFSNFNGFSNSAQSKSSLPKVALTSSPSLPLSTSLPPLSPLPSSSLSSSSSYHHPTKGTCHSYTGKLCSQFIGNRSILLESDISQETLEDNLAVLFEMIATSHQVSHQCHRFAISSICFYTFPICRQDQFHLGQPTVRKVCRDECEILESSICRKEYTMARSLPIINSNLLPKCQNLPVLGTHEDADCIQLGVPSSVRPIKDYQVCFNGNGRDYRGISELSISGQKCLPWSVGYNTVHYDELIGGHNYCRNPDGIEAQPWCLVDENQRKREFCDIPRCEDSYRVYYMLTPLLAVSCVILIIFILFTSRQLMYRKSSVSSYTTATLRSAQYAQPISPILCKRSPLPLWTDYESTTGDARYTEAGCMVSRVISRATPPIPLINSGESLPKAELVHYPRSSIKFTDKLCESDFGDILMGELLIPQGVVVPVAIRTLRQDSSPVLVENFKSEAATLATLQHTNIVCLLGVCFTELPLCMMFELMAEGNLLRILQSYNLRSASSNERSLDRSGCSSGMNMTLEIQDLLHISIQIAAGMEYLSSKHFTHRDLACRNCLVSDYLTVKISNFRLNREDYSSDYYCIPNNLSVPIRWLPPESIFYEKFTSASDVWSFGVVLWEIFTYGRQPYSGYTNEQVIDLIREGRQLACPEDCPPHFYSIMTECWRREPSLRPNFIELHNKLRALQAVETVRSARSGFPRVGPLRSVGSSNMSQHSGTYSSVHLTRNPMSSGEGRGSGPPMGSPRKIKRPITNKEAQFEASYSKLSFPIEKSASFGFV